MSRVRSCRISVGIWMGKAGRGSEIMGRCHYQGALPEEQDRMRQLQGCFAGGAFSLRDHCVRVGVLPEEHSGLLSTDS